MRTSWCRRVGVSLTFFFCCFEWWTCDSRKLWNVLDRWTGTEVFPSKFECWSIRSRLPGWRIGGRCFEPEKENSTWGGVRMIMLQVGFVGARDQCFDALYPRLSLMILCRWDKARYLSACDLAPGAVRRLGVGKVRSSLTANGLWARLQPRMLMPVYQLPRW